jgi:hypothetical protein
MLAKSDCESPHTCLMSYIRYFQGLQEYIYILQMFLVNLLCYFTCSICYKCERHPGIRCNIVYIWRLPSACLYTLVSPPVAPRRTASLYFSIGIVSASRQQSLGLVNRRLFEKLLSLLFLGPVGRILHRHPDVEIMVIPLYSKVVDVDMYVLDLVWYVSKLTY